MIVSLRVAAIAGLMAVASTPVMAQTTGTLPPQPPPYGVAPPPSQPPTTNQFSSNEIIDAGHRFFGGVSRGLAEIVEKAVSQWGLPNGYVLGQEASGAFIGGASATVMARSIQEMPVTCACSGKGRASVSMLALTVRGP
jgi:hypothetical protein